MLSLEKDYEPGIHFSRSIRLQFFIAKRFADTITLSKNESSDSHRKQPTSKE
jgi:hypothetical protein